ncbi:MAG: DUF5320 domain-containing protein [Candidatus Hodarchaeota archaeon]
MPGGDRTGPRGLGPMTGRALGYCAGYNSPGYARGPGMGRGWGRGIGWVRGRGRGWGYRSPIYAPYTVPTPIYSPVQPISSVDQLTMLKQEKEYLESEMKGIRSALEDISKKIEELESKE